MKILTLLASVSILVPGMVNSPAYAAPMGLLNKVITAVAPSGYREDYLLGPMQKCPEGCEVRPPSLIVKSSWCRSSDPSENRDCTPIRDKDAEEEYFKKTNFRPVYRKGRLEGVMDGDASIFGLSPHSTKSSRSAELTTSSHAATAATNSKSATTAKSRATTSTNLKSSTSLSGTSGSHSVSGNYYATLNVKSKGPVTAKLTMGRNPKKKEVKFKTSKSISSRKRQSAASPNSSATTSLGSSIATSSNSNSPLRSSTTLPNRATTISSNSNSPLRSSTTAHKTAKARSSRSTNLTFSSRGPVSSSHL
ncbi:hypothetical protein BJ684DRAFT_14359 [Piptocephalis cylindrospora]|uniref:Uncharacterized protein n=1 Tax=Piptocephalis cylindrospora TaxID=1907219 RepID=A0A4P9XZI8_9FUNG|nr:hypothetical protein BJ684DRAFT_17565 [Piptocephalis cylindrospora]RKP15403.1 hypothetical protein BJ684DRAFT_14359 [Piptocephalis cylindrospora]|eukprot:RKP11893.1 hypothetical protein BJ684DRAFT_17565 [Piptocephalis cylindrospora]